MTKLTQFKFSCKTKDVFEKLKRGDTPSFLYNLSYPAIKAYFFETPAMTKASMACDDFEFVLLDAPGLTGRQPDPRPYDEHFRKLTGNNYVAGFKSLGGDATLVAPKPINANGTVDCYGHLAAFMQYADQRQIHQFWKVVGETGLRLMEENPNRTIWMSTAGQGVPWLHLRFDTRPKYYNHNAYTADVDPSRYFLSSFSSPFDLALLILVNSRKRAGLFSGSQEEGVLGGKFGVGGSGDNASQR